MVRVQRVKGDGAETTWTVLGDDFLPVPEIELYFEHLRQTGHSPNTVKSYSRSLCLWWEFLGLRRRGWDHVKLEDMSAFLAWIRTGIPPDVIPLRGTAPASNIAPSTAALRIQAVRSFTLSISGADTTSQQSSTPTAHPGVRICLFWVTQVADCAAALRSASPSEGPAPLS